MDWHALDMELERRRCDFERRVEEGRREIRERIEGVERSCKEAEDARRRDWEELKGRLMTAEEERKHHSDGFLRLMSAMTDEYVTIARSIGEDMKREFAESRAESRAKFEELLAEARAQRQATLRMLDRLPPPKADSRAR
ncbi:MAG TPA: hypothetical protein VK480_03335 [Solirubrobacterales bacterium]|nr:hypothetical protein [Solirubrobacterales bacterium]